MNIKKYYKDVKLLFKSPSSYCNIRKFKSYMNDTAVSLGMNNSCFDSPSGASSYSYSTAYDLYLLSNAFFANDLLASYCSSESFDLNHRHIVNDAMYAGLSEFESPISLKTGTWGETHKALCLKSNDDILCVMSNNPLIFDNIFNVANQILQGKPINFDGISYYGLSNGVHISHNPNKHFVPASTTKLLTALCVYNICGLNGTVTIKPSDIVGGSGSQYRPKETFAIKDAVKIMLMESSNTIANALANTCGKML